VTVCGWTGSGGGRVALRRRWRCSLCDAGAGRLVAVRAASASALCLSSRVGLTSCAAPPRKLDIDLPTLHLSPSARLIGHPSRLATHASLLLTAQTASMLRS